MLRRFILILLIIILLWMMWAPLGRTVEWQDPVLALDLKEVVAADSLCTRNIVGIQPYMTPIDYISEGHFYEKLKGYFDEAQESSYFTDSTVVLLPEYLGTWLVISGEKRTVEEVRHIKSAMTFMVLSNPVRFAQALFNRQGEEDRAAAALFRMKSRDMARIYAEVFTELAQSYEVTICAGSIVLPGPYVENNKIKVDVSQPLYNASFVFRPGGEIDNRVVKKSFPISSEQPFVKGYPIGELPVFDLPIGKTVILVCADSWYPESYDQINTLEAEVVLVNSYCAGENTMSSKWKGYDGNEAPPDVDHYDIGLLTEQEAWTKYALPARLKNTTAKLGVNVFLRGELWDLGSDGQPFFVKDGELLDVGKSERAGIWNFCF